MKSIRLAFAALALSGVAYAQSPPPKIDRTPGTVVALSDTELTLAGADGKTQTITLGAGLGVIVSKSISVDEIQPGSYLGTTNIAKADGTGVSKEIHLSPGGKGQGLDFVMNPADNTTMTNGVVSTVVRSEGGRVLSVDYGTGVRRVTVPPGIPIVMSLPGDRSMIKVGAKIIYSTFTPAGGAPRQYITVGPTGSEPAH